jgi:hypothetical protein
MKTDFILRINKKYVTGFVGIGSSVKVGQTLVGTVLGARDSDDGEFRVLFVMIDKDIQLSRPA